MSKLLFLQSDPWSFELLHKTWQVIAEIAKRKYDMTYHEPQIEVVSANQMMHYSSMHGLPFMYNHWSFGKDYVATHKQYHGGEVGIAYEMIINTSPSLCYIVENNSMTLQALVLAHAAVGHSSFFRNNAAFKQWTSPETILDYARFARDFVAECESKYGSGEVELVLDAAHSLQYLGIDKYPRTRKNRKKALDKMAKERAYWEDVMRDETWSVISRQKDRPDVDNRPGDFPWPFPEENLLYFIEKNSPSLDDWQRELVRIVRTFSQYFYPQIQTKLMNEGWASFWHYTLMTDLFDEGYIDSGSYMEFLKHHTGVCHQHEPKQGSATGHPPYRAALNETLNPYSIGFAMFQKLRQAAENPTEKDYEELPTVAGKPWLDTLKDIANNYIDSTFVGQFLTSDIIEKFGFVATESETKTDETLRKLYPTFAAVTKTYLNINTIADQDTLRTMRRAMAERYAFSNMVPNIEVTEFRYRGDRSLVLKHNPTFGMALDKESRDSCIKNIRFLWGPDYPVCLTTVDETGEEFTATRRYR